MAMEQVLSLVDYDSADNDDIDLDLFNAIMQEQPPDPVKLSHANLEEPCLTSSSSLPSLEQTSYCPEDIRQNCELQATINQQNHGTYLANLSPESLQSDTSSDVSDFSFPMQSWAEFGLFQLPTPQQRPQDNPKHENEYEFKHNLIDELRATNAWVDDSKSNASCMTTVSLASHNECHQSDKQLVDLTTDTDSDCEDEYTQSQQIIACKRALPTWSESTERPLKSLCVRYSPAEECYKTRDFSSLKISPPFSTFTKFSNAATNLEPHLFDQSLFEGPMYRGCTAMPLHDIKSSFDSTSARLYSGNGVQDSLLSRGLPTPFSKDLNKEIIVQSLESLNSSFREEASLEEGVMTVSLLRHQRIALAWMERRERGAECAGGILADDQGLGKTVSTIALILKCKPSVTGVCPEKSNSVPWEEASMVDLDDDDDSCPISIGQLGWSCTSETMPGSKGRPSAGTLVVCPTSVLRQWAQELKEKVSAEAGLSVHLYHGSNRTKDPHELAKHDIVLTTYSIVSLEVPKQPLSEEKEADGRNAAHYSLSNLVGPDEKPSSKKKAGKGRKGEVDNEKAGPLAKVAWFRVVLDEAQSIKNRKTQAARACWALRAKRRWCLSGTPIQNTVDDLYSYFRFLKYDPFSVYKHFRSDIKDPITRNPGTGYRKLQVILHKILLRRTKKTEIDGKPIITLPEKEVILEQVDFTPEERAFYTNLESESRRQFQVYADAGTVQSNYVNILWMLLRLRQACDHPRLVKGGYSDAVERSSLEHASKLSEDKRGILLSILERNSEMCSICLDAPEDAVVTRCCHVFCRQCISDRLTQDDSASCPHAKCEALLSSSGVYSWSALKNPGGGGEGPMESSPDMPAQPYSNVLPESSSKIKAVINTLRALPLAVSSCASTDGLESLDSVDGRTEKAIVFSQWTSMLDLLEVSLKNEGFCYRRLDGTMSIQARDRALSDFKQLPNVTVIIMSLKAASLGLNMVAASHVLLIDVWWNPTTEDQAIDRAHRIGQTRVVHVSRFTVKNTIEDRILALQDRKRKMVASAFGEDSAVDQKTRLSMDEMRYLFRV